MGLFIGIFRLERQLKGRHWAQQLCFSFLSPLHKVGTVKGWCRNFLSGWLPCLFASAMPSVLELLLPWPRLSLRDSTATAVNRPVTREDSPNQVGNCVARLQRIFLKFGEQK